MEQPKRGKSKTFSSQRKQLSMICQVGCLLRDFETEGHKFTAGELVTIIAVTKTGQQVACREGKIVRLPKEVIQILREDAANSRASSYFLAAKNRTGNKRSIGTQHGIRLYEPQRTVPAALNVEGAPEQPKRMPSHNIQINFPRSAPISPIDSPSMPSSPALSPRSLLTAESPNSRDNKSNWSRLPKDLRAKHCDLLTLVDRLQSVAEEQDNLETRSTKLAPKLHSSGSTSPRPKSAQISKSQDSSCQQTLSPRSSAYVVIRSDQKHSAVTSSSQTLNSPFSLLSEEVRRLYSSPEYKRHHILAEIIETERAYVHDLFVTISVFLIPFRVTSIVTDSDIQTIFANIEIIANINQEFLTSLEDRMEAFSKNMSKEKLTENIPIMIGDIFNKMADWFRAYVIYCANQSAAMTRLRLLQNNHNVRELLNICHKDSKLRGANIKSYLIKPLQRVCKYPLLLQELVKNTPKEHPDYQALVVAVDKVKSVVAYIDEGRKASEELHKLIEIQNSVEGCHILDEPARRFIQEGPITYKRHGGRRKRPGRLYLFNDSLMIVHPKTGGLFETIGPRCKNPLELLKAHNDIVTPMMTKTQECEAHIPLSMCRIVNVADTEIDKHAIEVIYNSKYYTLLATDGAEKINWMRALKKHVKEYQKRQILGIGSIAGGDRPPPIQ